MKVPPHGTHHLRRALATGRMAHGGTLPDAPAPEWTRDAPPATPDLYATGSAAGWLERLDAMPPRLAVTCPRRTLIDGGPRERDCAHWTQGSEHPVRACSACGRPPRELLVDAYPLAGELVEEWGWTWWRPLGAEARARLIEAQRVVAQGMDVEAVRQRVAAEAAE